MIRHVQLRHRALFSTLSLTLVAAFAGCSSPAPSGGGVSFNVGADSGGGGGDVGNADAGGDVGDAAGEDSLVGVGTKDTADVQDVVPADDTAAVDASDSAVAKDVVIAPPKPCSFDVDQGVTGKECADDQVCVADGGTCSGVVAGKCKPYVSACPSISSPTCGCDGKTYDSICHAQKALIVVKSDGACVSVAPPCGGNTGGVCPLGQVCEPVSCEANAPGLCAPDPSGGPCPNGGPQECGCDGKTYPNSCYRLNAGVSKQSSGACPASVDALPCKIGPVGKPLGSCPSGQFCKLIDGNPFDCTGDGECVPAPPVCDNSAAPVCGCNFKSYANACEAGKDGMNVKGPGSCDGSCNVGSNECGVGKYCAAPQGQCSGKGTCIAAPPATACGGTISPVCGCNGKTYTNASCAAVDGVVLKGTGACGS